LWVGVPPLGQGEEGEKVRNVNSWPKRNLRKTEMGALGGEVLEILSLVRGTGKGLCLAAGGALANAWGKRKVTLLSCRAEKGDRGRRNIGADGSVRPAERGVMSLTSGKKLNFSSNKRGWERGRGGRGGERS